MITRADIQRTKWSLTKNLISDQTYAGVVRALNTTGNIFNVSNGLGDATSTSTVTFVSGAGFPDQRVSAVLRWVTTAAPDIGVILRVAGFHDTGSQDYLWARISGTTASITRVVDGAFTSLTSATFNLVIDTDVTIDFSAVGNNLTAVFTSSGVAGSPRTLTTTDSTIPQSGFMGFRSRSCGIWARSFVAEEL